MQFIDLKQHFVNRLPSVQPLCLQYVAVTFHGAAQSVSMEACLVARCCTVRVSTSFRMLVHFIRFLCRHGLVDASTENENKWVTMIMMMMTVQ